MVFISILACRSALAFPCRRLLLVFTNRRGANSKLRSDPAASISAAESELYRRCLRRSRAAKSEAVPLTVEDPSRTRQPHTA